MNPCGVSTVSLVGSRLGVAVGSPEFAPCGGSSGDKEKDAKENGVSYGCYSNHDINNDTNIHDLTLNKVDMNSFVSFHDNYYDAWYDRLEHFNINTDLTKHTGGAKAAKKRRVTDQTARNSNARGKRKNKYLETTRKKKRTWRECGASKTLRSPTGQEPRARAVGSLPAPPPSSTTQSPKGIHDQTQSVSAMLVRQGEAAGEEEWCAEQELKGLETEIGVLMPTGKKIKRTRKRTNKYKNT